MVHLTIDFNPQSLHAGLEDIRAIAPRVLRTRNTGSAALALAYVAAGYFDAMLHRYAHPWDYGAGVLMVREAGGVVTDIAGDPYTVASVAIVAAASEELRAALSRTISSVAPAAG
jgi:myo-inositol-1(or 4)-monophosphatase